MIDFPANPAVGQLHTAAGKQWRWDGIAWLGVIAADGITVYEQDTTPVQAKPGDIWIANQ